MSCLYSLEINPLWVASFVNIFFCSLGYLFILFMLSIVVQKLLSLSMSCLSIFICITLGNGSKEILLKFMSKSVVPVFSSKSFIVSDLTIKYLTHIDHWNIFSLTCWILWYHHSTLNMYSLMIFLNILLEMCSTFTRLLRNVCYVDETILFILLFL